MKRILCLLEIVLLTSFWSTGLQADNFQNLVVNGEFEESDVTLIGFPTSILGWQTTGIEFELWDQNYLGSPTLGFDGLGTGQHIELNADTPGHVPVTTQQFVIPQLSNNIATFSFDSWFRSSGEDFYSVSGSMSGVLVQDTQIFETYDSWFRTTKVFAIVPGETITISFTSGMNGMVAGAHIDQVSFVISAIPEPGTFGAAALGLICVLGLRRPR